MIMLSRADRTLFSSASNLNSYGAPPRPIWESELQQIQTKLISEPDSLPLLFRRAVLLSELGRLVEASDEYLEILRREPAYVEALNNLGAVLVATRHRSAARIAYQEAVNRKPEDPLSRVNLGNFCLEESQRLASVDCPEEAAEHKREARRHFEQALRTDPTYEKAHEGLSYVLGDLGEPDRAAWHRDKAFRHRFIIPLPFRGGSVPVPVLLLVSSLGGNVRLQGFLDDRIFQTFLVLPEFYRRSVPLPAHQLVINAIGDIETAPEAVAAAESFLSFTGAPVINPPAAVSATSRSDNARRFAAIPGVVTPITATVTRQTLACADAVHTLAKMGLAVPFLLRAKGFHTGQHFLRVENIGALPAALARIPGDELIAMQYLHAMGRDGNTRKYRVMFIDGELYPWHAAISSRWKVHYFSSDMADRREHRAEDAAFLNNMPGVLGPCAMKALQKIQQMLGLDYGGIDFSLGPNGEVLLFEANATMAVNPPDAREIWNYRRDAHRQITARVQEMLCKRIHEALKAKLHSRLHAAIQMMLEARSRSCPTVPATASAQPRKHG